MEMTWNIIAFFHVQLNLFMALHGVWKSAKKVALLNYWMTLRKKLFHDNLLMRLKSFLKHSSHSYKNETFLWDFQTLWSSLFLRAINHARWVSMRSACILMVSKKLVMVQKDQQRFNFQFASKASYINNFQLKQNISEIWIKKCEYIQNRSSLRSLKNRIFAKISKI